MARPTSFAARLAVANGAVILVAITVVLTSGSSATAGPELTARSGSPILAVARKAAPPPASPPRPIPTPKPVVPTRTSPAAAPRTSPTAAAAPRTPALTRPAAPSPKPAATTTPKPAQPAPIKPAPTKPPPPSSSAYTARLLALVNEARADNGLPALAPSNCAQAFAQAQAASMARRGVLDHQPLGPVLSDCRARAAGENVGYGNISADRMFANLMGSTVHRDNILNPLFTHLGNGATTRSDGRVYGSQVFLRAYV